MSQLDSEHENKEIWEIYKFKQRLRNQRRTDKIVSNQRKSGRIERNKIGPHTIMSNQIRTSRIARIKKKDGKYSNHSKKD